MIQQVKKPSLTELLNLSHRLLDECGAKHALIGGIAVGLRGYPRSTVDVDYLIRAQDKAIARAALEKGGFLCQAETAETLHFGGLGAIDFLLAQRPVSLQMLSDAQAPSNLNIPTLLVEDIIGLKIQAYHNDPSRQWKDLADIAELIRSNPDLDWSKVMAHAALFEASDQILTMRVQLGV